MKKIALTFLCLSLSTAALADDNLGHSGFNIGLNAGGAFGKSSFNLYDWEEGNEGTHDKNQNSTFIGYQVGYKYVAENGIMLGLEGDFQKSNYNALAKNVPYGDADVGQRISDIYTLRLKLGKMVNENTLAYLTGGYAYTVGDIKLRDGSYHTDGNTDKNVASNGWVGGFGLERTIKKNVSLKGEFLHLRTNGKAQTYLYEDTDEYFYAKTKFMTNMLRVGINYNF